MVEPFPGLYVLIMRALHARPMTFKELVMYVIGWFDPVSAREVKNELFKLVPEHVCGGTLGDEKFRLTTFPPGWVD